MRRNIERKLIEWKNKPNAERMPLLLYGARQVGKTYILDDFGERHFRDAVSINLETNLAVARYFDDDISPARILRFLETVARREIVPGQTLLILDEIQSCERALTSLKYFREQAPEYHVAAAGSLLGVAINRKKYSFPVGKVESLTLFSLDFEEFLSALGEERLAKEIRACYAALRPIPEALHIKAIELYRTYLIVGGMPAAVAAYVAKRKTILISGVQNEIVNNYVADMAKYAEAAETVKIRACYDSIPAQLAKENRKFQYKVVKRGGSSTMFGASIDWLTQAGIVLKCARIDHAYNPIKAYEDLSSFKLYMSDTGLLTMRAGLPQSTVLSGESNLFMGAVAENYIAQSLIAGGHTLYYWTSGNASELDFILQLDTEIVGVEVKKGIKTHSRSLSVFCQKYQPAYAIRFSEKNFGAEGANGFIRSIPHYAAFCV